MQLMKQVGCGEDKELVGFGMREKAAGRSGCASTPTNACAAATRARDMNTARSDDKSYTQIETLYSG